MADVDPEIATEDSLPQHEPSAPLLPDPGFLWQVFRRNLLLFLTISLMVGALTGAYVYTAVPIYVTRASLLIQPSGDPVRTSEPGTRDRIVDADQIDTEIRLIRSPIIARKAADLYADLYASPDGDAFTEQEINGLASRIQMSYNVVRSGQTSVIDVLGRGTEPSFAALSANLIVEAYLKVQVDWKTEKIQESQTFLKARLNELEQNALDAQSFLDEYRAERGLVSSRGGTNAEQEVSILNQQLASARANLAEKQGGYETAREQLARGSNGEDVGAALGSGTISSLRQQEARASAELAMLTEKYGTLYPLRRQTETELVDIRYQIQQEVKRVLSNLEAQVETAQSRVRSLERSREAAMVALTETGRAQGRLNELEQKAQTASAIYRSFLARSQENEALRDSATPDALFLDRAQVPRRPITPNVPLAISAGAFTAFMLGLFSILVAEYLRRGVQTKRDVEKQLRLRYAGAIPTLKSSTKHVLKDQQPHDYVINHPHSLFAESFRSIRAFLTLSPGSRPRALTITSSLPKEGKTTTSLCLARTTAAEGVKTILIDGDLRKRGVSTLIDYKSEKDLYDYLLKDERIENCIYKDEISGLDILGTNAPADSFINPISDERVERTLAELRQKYDVIIIDTAPVLGVAESRIWAAKSDRVLVIAKWKKTSVRAVDTVSDILIDAGARITGLAITQVNIKKYASAGDGDAYAYASSFRGYYVN